MEDTRAASLTEMISEWLPSPHGSENSDEG